MTPTGEGPPTDPARRVLLVRHGETEWSRSGRHTGRRDLPLDAEGEAQARRLRRHLRGWAAATVLVSPLQRARRTCELAGFARGAQVDPRMQEWDYGAYEGRTADEIQVERPSWTIWKDGVMGGETIDDVARRAESVIVRVRVIQGDVALFAHGHFLRILAARWCDLPAAAAEHLALSPAAVSVLGTDRGSSTVWRWNDNFHGV